MTCGGGGGGGGCGGCCGHVPWSRAWLPTQVTGCTAAYPNVRLCRTETQLSTTYPPHCREQPAYRILQVNVPVHAKRAHITDNSTLLKIMVHHYLRNSLTMC